MSEGRNEQNFPQNLSQPIVCKTVPKFYVQMCVCVYIYIYTYIICESKIAIQVA